MYDNLAQFYEWEHRDFRDDLPMYLGFARAAAGSILDAACGTGRVLLPLAEAGLSVTGVDFSGEMLEIARSKLALAPPPKAPRLVLGDLRTMELGEQYGMGLVALGSFQHLLSPDDQRRALERLAKHLKPHGLLIVDLVNPSPDWLAAGDGALVHQLSAPFPEPEGPDLLGKFVARTTRFENQREQWLLIYDRVTPEGSMTRRSYQMETRFVFRYEAEMLFAEAGFRLRDLYGDYGLDSYQSSSPRMILVAEKR